MNQPRPLFVTGTARSGSTLLARLLTANRNVMVASDPYLPLFRSLRNAIARQASCEDPTMLFDPAAPFQDYYFGRDRLRTMDAIQAGTLDLPFDGREWPSLAEAIRARASHECPDLLPLVDELAAPTYYAIFEHALRIICRARDCWDRKWVGCKEVWIIELFRSLAKALPDAKFVVLLRDPRATIASMLTLAAKDPSQMAQPLSFARHWRKYIAFTVHYSKDPLFAGRLHVLTYEELVKAPITTARQCCSFLGIDFEESMVDTSRFTDFTTGGVWQGNSSYEPTLSTIHMELAERWRKQLPAETVRFVEFICGPEMMLSGYEPEQQFVGKGSSADVLSYMIENSTGSFSWRSDFNDPALDYGFELFRQSLLDLPEEFRDSILVRRSFLFEDVFGDICQGKAVRERA